MVQLVLYQDLVLQLRVLEVDVQVEQTVMHIMHITVALDVHKFRAVRRAI